MNDIYVYIIPTNCELTTNLPGFPWNHIYLTSFGGGLLSSSLPCVKSAIQCCEYQPKSIVLENHFGNGHGQKLDVHIGMGSNSIEFGFGRPCFFSVTEPFLSCRADSVPSHIGHPKGTSHCSFAWLEPSWRCPKSARMPPGRAWDAQPSIHRTVNGDFHILQFIFLKKSKKHFCFATVSFQFWFCILRPFPWQGFVPEAFPRHCFCFGSGCWGLRITGLTVHKCELASGLFQYLSPSH